MNETVNRLLLCRVLLGDCVGDLGLRPELLQAGQAVSLLLAELPMSHEVSPWSGTMSQRASYPFGGADLAKIGSALPGLFASLQARQPSPSES